MFARTIIVRAVICFAVGALVVSGLANPACASDGFVYLPVVRRPADFDEFWQDALSELARWPLQPQVNGENLFYYGMYGKVCTGVYRAPADGPVTQAVIHFMDHGDIAQRTPANDGFAHLGLYWYPPDTRQQWTVQGLPDRHSYVLREAIVDGCRAVDALLNRPEVMGKQIGLTGEGVGGLVAMAVAALNPERTSFVVVEQPWPICHYSRDGMTKPASWVAAALNEWEARYPQWGEAMRSATTYFDLPAFRAAVKAPVLMLDGEQSAPLQDVGPQPTPAPRGPGLWTAATPDSHQAPKNHQQPATWEQVWRQWALESAARNPRGAEVRDTGVSIAAIGGGNALLISNDELFVPAEPVSLSW